MKIKLYSFKRSSFFIGLMISTVCFNADVLYAQNKTVQITQRWQANDSSWRNYERYTTMYDNNCKSNYDLREFWDTTTHQWKNAFQDSNYNNSFGSPDSIYSQSWNGNAWVNYAVLRYTYNNNHQLTSIITLFWSDDSLITGNKTAWTFDNNNFLVNQLYQRWDTTTNNWLNEFLYLYTNNPDGTPSVKHAEIGTADGTGWVVSSTITYYYYNNFGKDSVNVTIDSSSIILNENKQEFFYDANHYLINELFYYPNFNTGGWMQAARICIVPMHKV